MESKPITNHRGLHSKNGKSGQPFNFFSFHHLLSLKQKDKSFYFISANLISFKKLNLMELNKYYNSTMANLWMNVSTIIDKINLITVIILKEIKERDENSMKFRNEMNKLKLN